MAKMGMLKRQQRRADEAPTHQFEVRCHTCDVSFPPGTKKCMYCGNRPGARPLFTPSHHPEPFEDYGPLEEMIRPHEARDAEPRTSTRPFDADGEEVEPPRGMLIRMLGSLSWVLLFIAITVYRACNG